MQSIQCPHCQTAVQYSPQFAGQNVSCPQCGGMFGMPTQNATLPEVNASFSRAARNSGKRNVLLWIFLGIPGAIFMLGVFGAIVAEPESSTADRSAEQQEKYSSADESEWEEFRTVDFIDRTASFQGNQLELEMIFTSPDVESLRQCIGGYVVFTLIDMDANATAQVNILIPPSLSVPNARTGDTLLVSFECHDGRLDHGNVATAISRL